MIRPRWLFVLSIVVCGLAGCGQRGEPVYTAVYSLAAGPNTPAAVETATHVVRLRVAEISPRDSEVQQSGEAIVVKLYAGDDALYDRVRRSLEAAGQLEFAILAAHPRHDRQIELANAVPPTERLVKDTDGQVVAVWAPFDERQFPAEIQRDFVSRKCDHGLEFLTIRDAKNISGDMLEEVRMTDDAHTGKPCLQISFNARGSANLSELTGGHLPEPTGRRYALGILFDGKLLMGPHIMSRVADRAMLTGNFTTAELTDLAAALKSGALPGRLSLISETKRTPDVK